MTESRRALLALLALVAASGCRVEDDVGGDFNGPNCDCDAYFPICHGAKWTYDVVDQQNGSEYKKTLDIVEWTDSFSDRHWMSDFEAFRQRRVTTDDAKDSWLRKDGQRLLWLIDEWLDLDDIPTRTRYYVPGRVRIDETDEHLATGATWTEEFTEFRIEHADGDAEIELRHYVSWETTAREDHGEFTGALCQTKTDVTRDTSGNVVETRNAKYCFVPGVGKVYELTQLVDEEHLTMDRTIPGC